MNQFCDPGGAWLRCGGGGWGEEGSHGDEHLKELEARVGPEDVKVSLNPGRHREARDSPS